MTTTRFLSCLPFLAAFLFIPAFLAAQEPVSWLSGFTGDVSGGSSTLSYSFNTVDGNGCKLQIQEKETDKKGKTTEKDWVFYLSDLDPSAMSFKPSGKVIRVNLGIKNRQKFITDI